MSYIADVYGNGQRNSNGFEFSRSAWFQNNLLINRGTKITFYICKLKIYEIKQL